MQKVALVSALVLLTLLTLQSVAAREASVTINISYFENFNPLNYTNGSAPDLTDAIFAGNNPTPLGNGYVTIPLTLNQQAIIDTPGSDDVPGLYIERGQDGNGSYIDVSIYAFNYPEGYEAMYFSLGFTNAYGTSIVNHSIGPYEGAGDGICGITMPEYWGNDGFELRSGGRIADFCSMANVHFDRARVYYALDDILAPELTNIVVTPTLPHSIDENEGERFTVSFTSDEYPLTTFFRLLNDRGIEVHASANRTITNTSELPLVYDLPSSIHAGDYTLQLVAYDSYNNEARTTLGTISIDEDDSSSSDRRSRTLVSEEERAQYIDSLEEKRTPPRIHEEEPIVLETEKPSRALNGFTLSLVVALFISCILFALLIAIVLILKR